ncbi:hypothetical protein N657DRAFT_110342 [Parathielavia appendiculata]|uniref:Uncharacterized protein n=1 Tax=Parathielavia appendiculata TaxID=2587402 RepID=A0AAN6TVL6_9PEZI|nr:hypothetical protein N657DRAFT_110342 [Parathielavia appendiculata]
MTSPLLALYESSAASPSQSHTTPTLFGAGPLTFVLQYWQSPLVTPNSLLSQPAKSINGNVEAYPSTALIRIRKLIVESLFPFSAPLRSVLIRSSRSKIFYCRLDTTEPDGLLSSKRQLVHKLTARSIGMETVNNMNQRGTARTMESLTRRRVRSLHPYHCEPQTAKSYP